MTLRGHRHGFRHLRCARGELSALEGLLQNAEDVLVPGGRFIDIALIGTFQMVECTMLHVRDQDTCKLKHRAMEKAALQIVFKVFVVDLDLNC